MIRFRASKTVLKTVGAMLAIASVCSIVLGASILSNLLQSTDSVSQDVTLSFVPVPAGQHNLNATAWTQNMAMSQGSLYEFGLKVNATKSIPNCGISVTISRVGIIANDSQLMYYWGSAWVTCTMTLSGGQLSAFIPSGAWTIPATATTVPMTWVVHSPGVYSISFQAFQL